MSEENWRAAEVADHLRGLTLQEFFHMFRGHSIGWGNILFSNRYTHFRRSEISLASRLTPGIPLHLPLVTSPMDTVTKARMARAASDAGAIGIIHVNLGPSQAAREVSKVKRGGLITDPLVLAPAARLEALEAVRALYSHIPITANGNPNGVLVGMVSKHFRPGPQHEIVSECMEKPVSVFERDILYPNGTVQIEHALLLMDENDTDVLAVVSHDETLVGILVRSDLQGAKDGSHTATVDAKGRRRVGAAITTDPADYERRIPLLLENDVDVLCIDTAHGHSRFVVETITWIRDRYPTIEIIAGNISTAEAALCLIKAGAHALRVGNGTGRICTTQTVTRTGTSPAVGLYRVAQIAAQYNVPVIADGGIRNSGDIVAALALGASTVMVGGFVAHLPESAAQVKDGVKEYRGMASAGALSERVVVRYGGEEHLPQKPEGLEHELELATEPFAEYINREMAGVVAGFNNLGVRSIPDLHREMNEGNIRMEYTAG